MCASRASMSVSRSSTRSMMVGVSVLNTLPSQERVADYTSSAGASTRVGPPARYAASKSSEKYSASTVASTLRFVTSGQRFEGGTIRRSPSKKLNTNTAFVLVRLDAGVPHAGNDDAGAVRVEISSPPNARSPVSISYSTAPNAQMSARLSTGATRLFGCHVRGRSENHAEAGRCRQRRRH